MKNKLFKKILTLTLGIIPLLMTSCDKNSNHVSRNDWADEVKTAINDFIDLYGNKSKNYKENSYVVTDFDNTASIFDMYEQFMVYQVEVMGFAFSPEELPAILSSGLGDKNKDLTYLGYGNGSYSDWISDIADSYTYLYRNYGPFTASGLSEEASKNIQKDPKWFEFAAKILNMYYLIGDAESLDISYPWIDYWLTGMSEDEVYSLARKSHIKYRQVKTSLKRIEATNAASSRVGNVTYEYVEGVQVSENTKEMWQKISEAGIDIWVCSASECNVIKAAVDEFGLHNYCKGLIAMTPTKINNKMSFTYDYTSGYCWYANKDGSWSNGNIASGAQPQGIGKVTAIENICKAEYGCGPLAGFMDSTGDFNFCTEFKDLKFVICFNRANRDVTDGGSLIAEMAMYQKDTLKYDLKKANDKNDTYYVLQGRDENNYRTLRNSNKTIRLGETEETLFKNEQNEAVLQYMIDHNLSVKDALNKFSIKTAADAENNELGFKYGFLDSYSGYHSK